MSEPNAHPFRSPFVRNEGPQCGKQDAHCTNGESQDGCARHVAPFVSHGGANPLGTKSGVTLFGTRGAAAKRRGVARHAVALALTLLASTAASATVGPNIKAVQPANLPGYWELANYSTLTANAPNTGVNLLKPTCSAVTYMIGSDGVPRHVVVRKTIPAGDLTRVAASVVSNMRYAPGPDNAARVPVFTYIIVPFNLPSDPAARKRVTEACALNDFPQGYR